jgi:hypothetical protein
MPSLYDCCPSPPILLRFLFSSSLLRLEFSHVGDTSILEDSSRFLSCYIHNSSLNFTLCTSSGAFNGHCDSFKYAYPEALILLSSISFSFAFSGYYPCGSSGGTLLELMIRTNPRNVSKPRLVLHRKSRRAHDGRAAGPICNRGITATVLQNPEPDATSDHAAKVFRRAQRWRYGCRPPEQTYKLRAIRSYSFKGF